MRYNKSVRVKYDWGCRVSLWQKRWPGPLKCMSGTDTYSNGNLHCASVDYLTADFLQEVITKLQEWNKKLLLQFNEENYSHAPWEGRSIKPIPPGKNSTLHHRARERLGSICYKATRKIQFHANHRSRQVHTSEAMRILQKVSWLTLGTSLCLNQIWIQVYCWKFFHAILLPKLHWYYWSCSLLYKLIRNPWTPFTFLENPTNSSVYPCMDTLNRF